MKAHFLASFLTLLAAAPTASAQYMSGASGAVASEVPHLTIPYRIEDSGTKLPDITWGLDQAWISEGNMRRGLNFAGQEMIDIVRLSFQPSHSVEDGALSTEQKQALDERIRIAKYARFASINLNSDPQDGKAVDNWYKTGNATTNGQRWAKLIGLTKKYVESKGLKVVSISPFNEPDYTNWNQGTNATFKAICKAIREDEQFNGVLLCGGNVLNPDCALEWYSPSKAYLDEGNTHQLAGTFENFANFYKQVVNDGKVAVGDELHNTMECMVGSEYGLTKGIWWGTCDHTRSQFMKASRGTRLAYAENRDRWTAAAVYRHQEDYREGCAVQGFVGTSERQAGATTFRFAAMDHDVFYNGQGPTREFFISTPGWPNGAGYDSDAEHHCTNAEALVNIQGGDDIMPVLPTEVGTYRIVNRLSGKMLAPAGNVVQAGLNMVQINNARNNKAQQWIITPDPNDVGGDFTYYTFTNAYDPTYLPDVKDWSLEDQGQIILWNGGKGDNEKWCIEYASDGWFYIRSKHSGLYLQTNPIQDGNLATETQLKVSGRAVNQGAFTGQAYQQWRIINVDGGDVTYDAKAPAAPTDLKATPQAASVLLEWTAPKDKDLQAYIVQRSTDQTTWRTIHNNVTTAGYIDNTVDAGTTYYYRVQAVDKSLNRSVATEAVSAAATNEAACILQFDGENFNDATGNGNHVALYGTLAQTEGKDGSPAIKLLRAYSNCLQLPATIANSKELTIALWINYRSTDQWQRIFDFGNDTDHYVFLTPISGGSKMRLGIKNGGSEQVMDATKPEKDVWNHIAVTFGEDKIVIYLNGVAVATNTTIQTRPADFRPIFNYIGRSQFSDPQFYAYVDDLRIYNTAISAEEVAAIAALTDDVRSVKEPIGEGTRTSVFDLSGRRLQQNHLRRPGIYVIGGRKVKLQ